MSSSNILDSGGPNPQLESLIEKLEKTCERVSNDDTISVMRRDPTSAAYIPLRIKKIVKKTLSSSKYDKRDTATREDADYCEQLAQLDRRKTELELKLEEAVTSLKKDAELRFAESTIRIDTLLQDKDNEAASYEETIRKLKYELEQGKQDFQLLQIELTKKQNGTRRLEMQLHSVEEEAEVLRGRITYLEAIKLGHEKEMAKHTLSMDTLKMEMSHLQSELRELQESEVVTVQTLTDVQAMNKELQQEKRQLSTSLQKVTDLQLKLDKENVELEKMKASNENELQVLRDEQSHLSIQVDELDKSLGETELSRMDTQYERDHLKQAVAALTAALGKSKETMAEVQIQRGKLNNKIAKMAQDKADLVIAKVELDAEVVKLQESFRMSEERSSSLNVFKKRLEEKVVVLENKQIQLDQTVSMLEEEKLTLLQEKHDIQVQKDNLDKEKESEISSLHTEKTLELKYAMVTAKTRENELKKALQQQKDVAQQELKQAKDAHAEEVTSLSQQHKEIASQLREELESVSKVHGAEVSRHQQEKERVVSCLESDKAILNDRISKLQKMFDGKCEELHCRQHEAGQFAEKQKAQLHVSDLNAHRLETELVASEKKLWDLQNKLDEVKKKASDQLDSLKSELKDISHTVTKLEASNDDAKMTINILDYQNIAFQTQSTDSQRQLDVVLEEKESMISECHSLKQKLDLIQVEHQSVRRIVSQLREKLSKSEQNLSTAEKDAASAHQSLSGTEQAHAKLVSEHTYLQSSFTSSEKQITTLQLELNSALAMVKELNKTKEELTDTLAKLENELKIMSEKCQLKEKEVASFQLRASSLEREKHELDVNLRNIQEQAEMRDRVDAVKQSEYEATIFDLKTLCDNLQEKLTSLELALDSSQADCLEADSRLSVVSRQTASVKAQLKQNTALCKDLQAKYAQLVGVLEGTLGVTPSIEDDYVFSPSVPATTFNLSLSQSRPESGFGGSICSPTPSIDNSFNGEFVDDCTHSESPSKLSKHKLDSNAVRDAILDLQKRLMAAESSKHEAVSSAADLQKSVLQLREEKSSLDARLKSLRFSLVSLQTSFDSVSRQRDQAEVSLKLNATTISDQQRHERDLQHKVLELKEQLECDRAAKEESESRSKQCVRTQVNIELDRNKLETKARELELQRRQLEEEIVKTKTKFSQLETVLVTKDVDISRLQQNLMTSHHSHQQTEEQVKSLKEANKNLGTSYKLSQDSEKRLLEKIQQQETNLIQAQSEKMTLEEETVCLQECLDMVKKEKEFLEDDLRLLTHSQLESDTERVCLQEKVKELNVSLSDEEVTKVQLSTQLQSVEMKLQEQEGDNQQIACHLSDLLSEKLEMSVRLRQLEGDLDAVTKEKHIVHDLCGSLEAEIDHQKKSLHDLRTEHAQLKGDFQETALQNSRLDAIIANQQRQKQELDQTLVTSSKHSVELMKTVRELKESMKKEQDQKIKEMTKQVRDKKRRMGESETRVAGNEQDHKKSIRHGFSSPLVSSPAVHGRNHIRPFSSTRGSVDACGRGVRGSLIREHPFTSTP